MDYVRESELFNPYDHIDNIVKWIAIYYVADMEKGKERKGCSKKLHERSIKSRYFGRELAQDFASVQVDQFDNNVQPWDLTFEQLHEAYKTTAMKRHLAWNSIRTYEKTYCLPFFKVRKEIGDFPRRITWLYVDEGKNKHFSDLQTLKFQCYHVRKCLIKC